MSPVVKLKTGIGGLDALTGGGLPEARTTLITGRSGAGKSILALQLGCSLVRHGYSVVYVTAEERPEDILVTGDSLGFDASSLVKTEQLRILDLRRPTEGPTIVVGDYDTAGFVARLLAEVRESKAKAVIIDSITALFQPRPAESVLRAQCAYIIGALEASGLTVILTTDAPSDYSRPTLLGVEDYICDAVLILRNAIEGKRRRRSMEVHKYRRSHHQKGEYPFTISDRGISVFPLDMATRAANGAHSGERFSSGIDALDAMSEGGWLRGSIVLVRGPSGSGKTTFAGMHARAAAQRGERVAFYGFEETKPILLRSFEALQLPLEPLLKDGTLRVVCHYAEATSTEDLLIEIRHDLLDFAPSIVVFDSLSSIECATSTEGYRVFLTGLVALIREGGRSAILTEMVEARAEAHQGPPFLAAAADALVILDYSADATELHRTLRVLKMRGSSHDTRQRALSIHTGGLVFEPVVQVNPE